MISTTELQQYRSFPVGSKQQRASTPNLATKKRCFTNVPSLKPSTSKRSKPAPKLTVSRQLSRTVIPVEHRHKRQRSVIGGEASRIPTQVRPSKTRNHRQLRRKAVLSQSTSVRTPSDRSCSTQRQIRPQTSRHQHKFDTKQTTKITHATLVSQTTTTIRHVVFETGKKRTSRGTQFGKGPHGNIIVTRCTPGTDHHHHGLRAGHTIALVNKINRRDPSWNQHHLLGCLQSDRNFRFTTDHCMETP
jgi:hypothetical protein